LHWAIRYDGRGPQNGRYNYLDTEKPGGPGEFIKLFLEYGASIEAPSCKSVVGPFKNYTSLDAAVHQRNGDAVRVLVEMAALVDPELKRVEREMMPLYVAVEEYGKGMKDIESGMRRKGTLEEDGQDPRYVGFDCIYFDNVYARRHI
jgi:hypothetical protein